MRRLRLSRILRVFTVAATVALGALAASAPAHADTPLPAPTGLQVLHVADTTADLYWASPCYSTEDVVQRYTGGSWRTYAANVCSHLALSGLAPGTAYTFRVYSAAVPGIGYSQSPPSAPLSFTTLPGPDGAPPSTPAKPTFSSVTTTAANVFWPQSTDNVEVAGYYLQQLVDGTWTTLRTVGASGNFQGLYGLAAATSYTFAVIAFDARGNSSPRSEPGTLTTLAVTAAPSCQVQLQVYGGGSFSATASIVNTTAAAINGWTLAFSLPAAATVNTAFNGVLTRSGGSGAITPVSYDTVIGPGAGLFVGFSGWANPASPPSGFTFNGLPCAAA
jgi:hypothetical protein